MVVGAVGASLVKIMKKAKFYFIFYGAVCILAILGAMLGMVAYSISEKHPDYFTIQLWQGIIIFFISIWLSSFLHELVHGITFLLNGQKIRMFYIFPFCFIKETNGIKIRLAANWLIGLGGIVIPELKLIKNHDELKQNKISLQKSLLSAPLCSALLGILSLLLAMFATDYVSVEYRSWFFLFFAANLLVAVYINLTSLLFFGGIIGDYAACRLLTRNKTYLLLQMYNYYLLQRSEVKTIFREKNSFFHKNMLAHLLEKQNEEPGSEICSLLDAVIYEELIRHTCSKEIMDVVSNYITNHMEQMEKYLPFYEAYYRCFGHLIIYMYINGNGDMAEGLWNKNRDKIPSNKVGKYVTAQVEMARTGIKNEDLFLKKKIAMSSMDCIVSCMENYFEDELEVNWMILDK